MDSIPGSGSSPGGGHGHPLQYSCLENSHEHRSLDSYSPCGHKAGGNPLFLEGGSAFLFCSCLQLIGWGPPTEGRAVCLLANHATAGCSVRGIHRHQEVADHLHEGVRNLPVVEARENTVTGRTHENRSMLDKVG